MTPLIMAAHLGHAPVATALIKAGADVNAQDDRGETALSAARSRTRSLNLGSWQLLWKRKVGDDDKLVRLLIEAGANK